MSLRPFYAFILPQESCDYILKYDALTWLDTA